MQVKPNLPEQIRELPDGIQPGAPDDSFMRGYRFGHRAARHAAAELAAAALSAAPAQEPVSPWGEAALAFERRAMRVEYVIRMMVAAGHVTQEKVDEAFSIAKGYASPLPQEVKALTDAPLPPEIEGRLSVWLTLGKELHPLTVNLVVRFARALAAKLADAEKKYGYSDGWRSPDWMDECRAHLLEHLAKGDPRDVAAYCAFLWHHGESTASPIEREVTGAQEGKAGEWLPIESAPKDGSSFLIWTKRLGFAVVSHDVDDPMPTGIVPSGHRLVIDDGKFAHPIRGDYPTHWMPLPPPPSAILAASREGEQR